MDDILKGKRVFYDEIIEAQSHKEDWIISEGIIRSLYGEYLHYDVFECDENGSF